MVAKILPTAQRVAWCASCEVYVDEREIGRLCPSTSCDRKLRVRVGYICPNCECQNIFFDRERYVNHRCEDYGP